MAVTTIKPDLKKFRLAKNWTQQEAAERIGISRSYYSMVEIGHRMPSVQMAQKIESVFGIAWPLWFNKNT